MSIRTLFCTIFIIIELIRLTRFSFWAFSFSLMLPLHDDIYWELIDTLVTFGFKKPPGYTFWYKIWLIAVSLMIIDAHDCLSFILPGFRIFFACRLLHTSVKHYYLALIRLSFLSINYYACASPRKNNYIWADFFSTFVGVKWVLEQHFYHLFDVYN